MNDSRCQHIKDELLEALLALNADIVNPEHVAAILDDARGLIVDVVQEGISEGMSKRDMNHLDSARTYINTAVPLLGKSWAWASAERAIGHALEYVELATTNVVALRRNRSSNTPGGAA